MTELTKAQEEAQSFLATAYDGCASDGPDAAGFARLEAYNGKPRIAYGNVLNAVARWTVGADGKIYAAWDPDNLVDKYEVERQAREEYS